jgi:hypothetical protein
MYICELISSLFDAIKKRKLDFISGLKGSGPADKEIKFSGNESPAISEMGHGDA